MSDFSNVIPLILDNKLNQAKSLLEQRLFTRMGVVLENKLEDYAPTIFMSEEEKALWEEAKKKKPDEDGDGVPDWADKKPGEDDTEEEDEDEDEDEDEEEDEEEDKKEMKEEYEAFIDELASIVEEIGAELGEELTEEEVQEIAEELLSESDDDSDEETICEDCNN